MRDMVTVAAFTNRIQGEHAIEFLKNNKIDAVLWSDDAGGLNPAIGFVESYQIRVNPNQENLAKEILSDFGFI